MEKQLSKLHKLMLWLMIVVGVFFGIGYFFVPVAFSNMMNVEIPDIIAIISIGGFLIAAVVGAYFSLRSDDWEKAKITTYYLATWNLLNGIRIGYYVLADGDLGLLPNSLVTLIVGIGLGYEIIKRLTAKKKVVKHKSTAASH